MVDQLDKILRGALPLVLILITIAVTIGVGSQVIDTTRGLYDTDDTATNVVNESFNISFNVVQNLNHNFVVNTSMVLRGYWNATSVERVLSQGEFELSAAFAESGRLNITNTTWDDKFINASYTYTSQDKNTAFNASTDGLAGLATFSSFQPTFAVIIVAVLILMLLIFGLVFVGMRII